MSVAGPTQLPFVGVFQPRKSAAPSQSHQGFGKDAQRCDCGRGGTAKVDREVRPCVAPPLLCRVCTVSAQRHLKGSSTRSPSRFWSSSSERSSWSAFTVAPVSPVTHAHPQILFGSVCGTAATCAALFASESQTTLVAAKRRFGDGAHDELRHKTQHATGGAKLLRLSSIVRRSAAGGRRRGRNAARLGRKEAFCSRLSTTL